jgi:hypothetical protein
VVEDEERQFNNHYSPTNLDAAFAIVRARVFQEPTPQPELQKKTLRDTRENILALAGVKADTGRVNHAHSHEVQPVSEQQARQVVLEAVARFARSGHGRFAKTLTDAIKAQSNANESWTDILGRVQEYAAEYTGTLLIKQMIEHAPGATTGARAATRERFARIAEEGRNAGMKASEIARIIRIESDGLSNRSIS